MKNEKIILEKTTDHTMIVANATGETTLYLLAALITNVCEKSNIPTFEFLRELAISCKAFEAAKTMSEDIT